MLPLTIDTYTKTSRGYTFIRFPAPDPEVTDSIETKPQSGPDLSNDNGKDLSNTILAALGHTADPPEAIAQEERSLVGKMSGKGPCCLKASEHGRIYNT